MNMCGVAAIYGYHSAAPPVSRRELVLVRNHMTSRGPDGARNWMGDDGRIGLGHCRLAIIDVDARAAQPMASGCGRFVVSFNGEIYNYQELRGALIARGCRLRTHSDTEVLLEWFAIEGCASLRRFRGMFAFALWDERERALWLGRDSYGIKPLYYADDGWTVRAASQVKALLAGGNVSRDPEPAGIASFFLFGSVLEPFTCWQEIRAVPAGCTVRVDVLGAHAPESFAAIPTMLRASENAGGYSYAPESLRAALMDTVRHHLIADVPVSLFLSAGIDSGALLALAAECRGGTAEGIQAITVTYPEYRGRSDDEAPLAAEIAQRYGAMHTVRTVDRAEFSDDLPRILEAMDQPTIDGINTWFVSKATRESNYKVALSGLGGDELFGGYPSFHDLPRLVRMLAVPSRVPLLGRLTRGVLDPLLGWSGMSNPKLPGLIELGGTWPGAYLLRRGLFMPWELDQLLDPDLAREGLRRLGWSGRLDGVLEGGPRSAFGRVAALEASVYMRNQLLRDADWASMAHSVEARVPLVDATLLRAVTPDIMARPGRGKQLLAQSLRQPLPDACLRRAKTGFTTPMAAWLGRITDDVKGGRSRPEPWARRWARVVARHALPAEVLRHSPAQQAPVTALLEHV